MIEVASDLLPEASDGAAEVLHYLRCRSLNESFPFIPDMTLTGAGIHLFQGNVHGTLAWEAWESLRSKAACVLVWGGHKSRKPGHPVILHFIVTSEVKEEQPLELSLLLPHHVTLRWMADLRGCD